MRTSSLLNPVPPISLSLVMDNPRRSFHPLKRLTPTILAGISRCWHLQESVRAPSKVSRLGSRFPAHRLARLLALAPEPWSLHSVDTVSADAPFSTDLFAWFPSSIPARSESPWKSGLRGATPFEFASKVTREFSLSTGRSKTHRGRKIAHE